MNGLAIVLSSCALAGLAACATSFGTAPNSQDVAIDEDINATERVFGPSGILVGTPPQPPLAAQAPAPDNEVTAAPATDSGKPMPGPTNPYGSLLGSGDKEAGHRFALNNCRPCHVVAGDRSSPVRFANAPNFATVANDPKTTAFGLNVWLTNPHPTMPTLVLTTRESADIIAYIMSLRGPQ